MSSKDNMKLLPTLAGSSNYPIWSGRMKGYLAHKKLWTKVITNPSSRIAEQQAKASHIITTKIGNHIYKGIITAKRMSNGYDSEIWSKITCIYGMSNAHNIGRALLRWQNLRFEGNLTSFIEQVESCLAQFDSIEHTQGKSAIGGMIISKISARRSSMTDSILMNTNLMENSELLLEKPKDMANHDNHAHKANHAKRTAIAMYGNSINRRPSSGCCNGVHNPEAMHPKEKCWALHPEQRTKRNLASRITSNNLSNRITTNHVKAAPEQTRPQNMRNPPLPTSHLPNCLLWMSVISDPS
jgi:hypothetical protein